MEEFVSFEHTPISNYPTPNVSRYRVPAGPGQTFSSNFFVLGCLGVLELPPMEGVTSDTSEVRIHHRVYVTCANIMYLTTTTSTMLCITTMK